MGKVISMRGAFCLAILSAVGTNPSDPADQSPRRADSEVMAYVNERPIHMKALNDFLIRSYGLSAAHQLIANELVRQEASKGKVTITDAEVAEETSGAMKDMFPQVSDAGQRERLLDQLLARSKLSRIQWQMTMRRNAILAKIVDPTITVSEDELRRQFGDRYGRKVQVRHIQTTSLPAAQMLLKQLAKKADFAELARKYSKSATAKNGGLLPPIGKDSPGIRPVMRQAALSMKKVGEISAPIQVGTAFHILKLERIIEPEHIKFADVKDKLAKAVRARRRRLLGQQLLQKLIRDAKLAGRIRYVHPVLKAKDIQAPQGSGP